MPDHMMWPPLPRRIATTAKFFAYATTFIAGFDVLAYQIATPMPHMSATITVIAATTTLGAFLAMIATPIRLWRLEFVAIAFAGGALVVYNIIDWSQVPSHMGDPMHLKGPSIVSAAFWWLVYRGAELFVFSLSATRSKRLRDPRPVG